MTDDIAIAWLDGIRQGVEEPEPREALLKGIEAIEKQEKIEQILSDNDFDIPFDEDHLRLIAIADVLGVQIDE